MAINDTMIRDPITKIQKIFVREDGSEAKIIAESMFGKGLHHSANVTVFRRESAAHAWQLCGDQLHPDWRSMSVDEYTKSGRPEMFKYVSIGEILSMVNMLGRPLSDVDRMDAINNPQRSAATRRSP